MAKTFDVSASIHAQKKYCEEHNAPDFAPKNGVCWNCNKNIYQEITQKHSYGERTSGIPTEEAADQLVTGCPHCYRSYCD